MINIFKECPKKPIKGPAVFQFEEPDHVRKKKHISTSCMIFYRLFEVEHSLRKIDYLLKYKETTYSKYSYSSQRLYVRYFFYSFFKYTFLIFYYKCITHVSNSFLSCHFKYIISIEVISVSP